MPRNPMGPVNAVVSPARMLVIRIQQFLKLRTLMPMVVAYMSPNSIASSCFDRNRVAIKHKIETGAINSNWVHVMAFRLPMVQLTNSLRESGLLKYWMMQMTALARLANKTPIIRMVIESLSLFERATIAIMTTSVPKTAVMPMVQLPSAYMETPVREASMVTTATAKLAPELTPST